MKKIKLFIPIANLIVLFNFKSSLFLEDVPYVIFGTLSSFLNFNNKFILKNNY
ncbi:MAG: hypothetical protein KAH04_04385 [Psychrilyobacter sp.]|nr:hypothetical protein [Psychrilyobacter sp.]